MKKHRLLFSIMGALLITLAVTVTAWTYTSANYSFPITQLGTGSIGTVTFRNQLFTDLAGKNAGVELYRIDLGSPTLSNNVKIHVLLLDYDRMKYVLDNNPDLWVDVSIWYPGGTGTHRLSDGTVVSQLDSTRYKMTWVLGNVCLVPTVTMQSTLYVMARVLNPAEIEPPGRQTMLQNEVAASVAFFFCEVRTL